MSKVTDIRDWAAQRNFMAAYEKMPDRITDSIPYADRETSDQFLPDEDEEYEKMRQEEIEEARRERVESLNECLREIGRLQDMPLCKRQI